MSVETFFPLLGVGFLLVSWGLVILGRHLAERNRILAAQVLHKERTHTMPDDVALPQSAADLLSPAPPAASAMPPGHMLAWFRIVALCFGFLLLFGGVGIVIGFGAAHEEDLTAVSTIGWVPAPAGAGLLVFYRLSRGLAAEFTDR